MPNTPVAAFGPVRPKPDKITQFFWDGAREHRLMILRCTSCGYFQHWPRPFCRKCRSSNLSPEQVSGKGVNYTHTVCTQAFHPWWEDKLPYVLSVVELIEQPGLKLISNIVNIPTDEVVGGMALRVLFREVAEGLTLPLFEPDPDPRPPVGVAPNGSR